MAKRAGPAIHIHLVRRDPDLVHEGHGNDGKGLVHLPKIDISDGPAELVHELGRGRHRRGGEPLRRMRVAGMAENPRTRAKAFLLGSGAARHHQRRRTIGNRRGICGRHRAVPGKGGFQMRDLFRPGLAGLLVSHDQGLALAHGHRNRCDFPVECAVSLSGLGALERAQREFILRRARELIARGAILSKAPHQPAAVIGILEPVEEHMILHRLVAEAGTATHGRRQVGRIGHAFHTAGDNHPGAAGAHQVMRHHHRLHSRPADLVEGRGRNIFTETGGKPGLARRCLADAGRQHAAHDHLVDRGGIDARIPDRTGDGGTAELRRGKRRKLALERPHRGSGCTCDHNLCGPVGHSVSPLPLRHPALKRAAHPRVRGGVFQTFAASRKNPDRTRLPLRRTSHRVPVRPRRGVCRHRHSAPPATPAANPSASGRRKSPAYSRCRPGCRDRPRAPGNSCSSTSCSRKTC